MSQENNVKKEAEINESKAEASAKLSIDYILEKIEKLDSDMRYLYDAIKAVGEIPSGADAGPAGDVAGAEKAKALSDIVKCRETTKQQMLNFYTGLLNDLRKQETSNKQYALDILKTAVESDSADKYSIIEQVNYVLDAVRHIDN